ncbi:MAG: methanogenesis marker 12 protein [Methanocellales archaeon]|nr:methanogenesis marker 12 protein [Methanocellales archaeon]
MFIGMDHGTTAIRFGTDDRCVFELSREDAKTMPDPMLLEIILSGLEIEANDIDLFAISYSMGDGISKITDIERVVNRGVRRLGGAGIHIGGGTHVFDVIKRSGIPAIVIPGIHSRSDIDRRMKMFSHGASPEKVGIAYHASLQGYDTFIVSDISSNTVTVGVADGKIIGALDACIFAPGILHGPLDLDAIRYIDAGKISANEAFSHGGILKHTNFGCMEELLSAEDESARLALDRIALFAAMEIAGMQILVNEYSSCEAIFLSGELDNVKKMVEYHLDTKTIHFDKWSAAIGCAEIARDVHAGKKDVLGIKVDLSPTNKLK